MYSPVWFLTSPMDANARTATAVAPSSGVACCPQTAFAASIPSSPFSIRTFIPSTTTIALSTSMPSAMISAPSEIRSSAMPCRFMITNVAAMVRSRMNPMMRPLRRPMANRRPPPRSRPPGRD